MTFTEFESFVKTEPHALSDIIHKGEIDFSDLIQYIKKISIPPLIKIALLCHPNCTRSIFEDYYSNLVRKTGDVARNTILIKAPALAQLDVIAVVIGSGSLESDFRRIMNYSALEPIFKKIMKNPYTNEKFKMWYCEETGNLDYLPKTAQDIFIF